MAWQSSGGYPGVTSDGSNGLVVVGAVQASQVELFPNAIFKVDGPGRIPILTMSAGVFNDGAVLKNGIGMFGVAPPSAATTGGAATAGGTYTAVEQGMLEAAYTALRSIGLIT